MTDIDVETGLPSLPADHRWVVAEQIDWSYGWRSLTGGLVVRIESSATKSTTTGRWWWKRNESVDSWSRAQHSEDVVVQGKHPIAVFNAAHRCLNLWNANIKRNELIGVYPPNRLSIPTGVQL